MLLITSRSDAEVEDKQDNALSRLSNFALPMSRDWFVHGQYTNERDDSVGA